MIDLSQATFIDSTIVGILLEGLAESEKLERPLLLLLPDDSAPEVHRLFELTGLDPCCRSSAAGTRRRAASPH